MSIENKQKFKLRKSKKYKNLCSLALGFRSIIYDEKIFSINNEKWKTCIKTFIKYQEYIENAIIYSYTNGITESFNRLIKNIKRDACGYRNYNNFRTRVMLYFNLIKR